MEWIIFLRVFYVKGFHSKDRYLEAHVSTYFLHGVQVEYLLQKSWVQFFWVTSQSLKKDSEDLLKAFITFFKALRVGAKDSGPRFVFIWKWRRVWQKVKSNNVNLGKKLFQLGDYFLTWLLFHVCCVKLLIMLKLTHLLRGFSWRRNHEYKHLKISVI